MPSHPTITHSLCLLFPTPVSHLSVFLVSACLDLSLDLSAQAGWLSFISFCLSECHSLDPPSHSCSLGPFPLSFLSSFPFPYFLCCSHSPSLSSSLSVFVFPSHGCFISLCLCISPSVPPLFLPLSLFLCVSGFCSDGPSACLYFYPSDTPPVSTSLSVCLSPSRFSSGPSSWSQLVGGRQGSRWPPTPGSSLPLAAPNEPGVGVTRCPRPPGLRHWPLRGLWRRYKGAASLAAGSPLRGRAPCKLASGVGGWMMGSGFWSQTRASLSSSCLPAGDGGLPGTQEPLGAAAAAAPASRVLGPPHGLRSRPTSRGGLQVSWTSKSPREGWGLG